MARLAYGLEIGASIGGYRIDGVIGRGGMGVVYAATHQRLKRKAALKILSPELADDESFRERFIRESQLAASLDHPSVIPIYDADEEDGVLYLAMRYVDGLDLERLLEQRGRLSLDEALGVIEPVASALDAAHAHGLVHRDVKPANILIENETGRMYLTDFGLAKLASSTGFTRTGSFLGTVHYCAPEQIEGRTVTSRADIYALGCVLFHCLAGQPPFARESEVAVIHAHLTEPPPAVTTLRPDLPRFVDGVVVTAMAKFPEVRYSRAHELVAALRAGEPTPTTVEVPARPAPPSRPAPVLSPTTLEAAPPSPPPPAPPKRKKPWLLVGAVLAAVVAAAAAVAAIAVTRSGGEAVAKPPASSPPAAPRPKSLTSLVAARLDSRLIPLQQRLTDRVDLLTGTAASFEAMERSARALRSAVLQTEGWAGASLEPRTQADAAVKKLLSAALAAQAAYASYLEALPADPSRFTKSLATGAIRLADRAEEAYARLDGAAASLPAMPLHRADHLHLLAVVPKPAPKPKPTPFRPPVSQPSSPTPSADDRALVESVISRHWQAINAGDYERAYNYFSRRLQSQQARSSWIRDKLVDRPRSSQISIGSVSISGDVAYANVSFATVGQETSPGNTGCNRWAGSYRLVKSGSSWFLDKSTLQRTSVDCASLQGD